MTDIDTTTEAVETLCRDTLDEEGCPVHALWATMFRKLAAERDRASAREDEMALHCESKDAHITKLEYAIGAMAATCGHYTREGGSMEGLAAAIEKRCEEALHGRAELQRSLRSVQEEQEFGIEGGSRFA